MGSQSQRTIRSAWWYTEGGHYTEQVVLEPTSPPAPSGFQDYKDKLTPLATSQMETEEVSRYFSVVDELIKIGTINRKTDRLFDLSHTDKRVLSGALAHGYKITTGDRDLIRFAKQEFRNTFKENISPLEIINMWLENDLILSDNSP